MNKRAVLIVLDSVGVGELPDAARYGDEGSNTLSHVAKETKGFSLPNMAALGLGCIEGVQGLPCPGQPGGGYGRMAEKSKGKDTTTGHWELAGLRLDKPFPTYPNGFPREVIDAFCAATGRGVLGNKAASGTVILEELGEQHMRTGDLIVYTSADSVFQIAAHEEIVPPEQLYEYCRMARQVLQGEHAVGRVIARPFVGRPGAFERTGNRRDFSLPPVGNTVLDDLTAAGIPTYGVGKIEDIFAHRGLAKSNHAAGNPACVKATLDYLGEMKGGFLFVNLVDFDSQYGHRNNAEATAVRWSSLTRRCPTSWRRWAGRICCSSRPTTAATPPPLPPTTRGNMCRFWHGRRPWSGAFHWARCPPLRLWPQAWQTFSGCPCATRQTAFCQSFLNNNRVKETRSV